MNCGLRMGFYKIKKKKHKKKGGYIFESCLDICKISPSSVIVNKKILCKYGLFDTKLKVCEDYELWLRLTSKIQIGYVEEPMIKKYAGHSGQLSKKYWGMDKYRIKALEKLLLNHELPYAQKVLVLDMILKKINIIILGSINRLNKRILEMYVKKFFFWRQYYYQLREDKTY